MKFQPTKQINAILQQEYFEPTISWAMRVVFALNVPLLLLPLKRGYSLEIIWMAFTAYLLSLLDFRGPHSQKIFIQIVESMLLVVAAVLGMNVSGNVLLSVLFMFIIGMFAALIRNWSDYGAAIGVAMGFFYLFGLSSPVSFSQSLHIAEWMFLGSAWALFITIISFPFQISNPLKRSVAVIWKKNTELLDTIIQENFSSTPDFSLIAGQEIAVRTAINKSIELFKKRTKDQQTVHHYDILIELRRISSLFGASITSLQEELETLQGKAFEEIKSSVIYKTLSAFGQASARIAIVIFTERQEDMTLAKIRVHRCAIAIKLFKEASKRLTLSEKETRILNHFLHTLQVALDYLEKAIVMLEKKTNLQRSSHLEEYKLTFNNFLSGLNPYEWVLTLRTMFNVNSQQFKYALRVGIAVSLGVFIFSFFKINHGYWIPLTIIIVIQPYYGATLKRGIERVIGTAAGITAGGIINLLTLPHFVFVVMLIVVSFCVVYFIRHNYKVGVFFLTLMMVVLLHLSSQASWQLIGWRLVSTFIGAALAVGAGYAFWPVWEKQRFPSLMSNAMQQNKKYFGEVLKQLSSESNDQWIKQRNKAEAANSDVFACVQRMSEEPKHMRRDVATSFELVGINIRITREITSIALGVSTMSKRNKMEGIENFQVLEIFDLLKELILKKEEREIRDLKKLNIAVPALTGITPDHQHFIKTEMEKIFFELETMYLLASGKEAVNTRNTETAHL
jgi:uncharacterized membrane protein YccC